MPAYFSRFILLGSVALAAPFAVTLTGEASAQTRKDGGVDQTTMDGATYEVRLRDLEVRIDELNDSIRRHAGAIKNLGKTSQQSVVAEVDLVDEMSSAFRLIKATFAIDGVVQYTRADETGALADMHKVTLFAGSITTGDHMLHAELTFQGNGTVFTYMRGYKFYVTSAHPFTSPGDGKALAITATAYEQGDVTTPLQNRPKIAWTEKATTPSQAP